MTKEEFIVLAEKVASGNASLGEIALYDAGYDSFQQEPQSLTEMGLNTAQLKKESLARFWKATAAPVKTKLWPRVAGIAAAVIGIAICVWLYTSRHPELVSGPPLANDIAPGGNRATLTLANGKTINLSDKKSGVIVGDALKYDDNTFVIQSDSEGPKDRSLETRDDKVSEAITATTPKGGMYSIILQDGTKVWLNADSKLEFFSNYRNKLQRIVKLIAGEAYFEVAKNRAKPFIVESNGQRIEVLGTHFNVSAYTDDIGIRTTLLEGSVRVFPTLSSRARTLSSRANAKDLDPSELGMTKETDGVVLKPHQQAITTNNQIEVKNIDPETAIAWREGIFAFNNESLASIMPKIARWYNVEVIFENPKVAAQIFSGSVSRFEQASSVLRKLEKTGPVKFRIEGKKVYVGQ